MPSIRRETSRCALLPAPHEHYNSARACILPATRRLKGRAETETPPHDRHAKASAPDSRAGPPGLGGLEGRLRQDRTQLFGKASCENPHGPLEVADDDVVVMAPKIRPGLAKSLSNPPPQGIALDGRALDLEGDAQAKMPELVRNPKNNDIPKARDGASFEESKKVLPLMKSERIRKRKGALFGTGRPVHKKLLSCNFRSELLAALRTTPLDYRLARRGFHAGAEPVAATAFGTTGLISAFHRNIASTRGDVPLSRVGPHAKHASLHDANAF